MPNLMITNRLWSAANDLVGIRDHGGEAGQALARLLDILFRAAYALNVGPPYTSTLDYDHLAEITADVLDTEALLLATDAVEKARIEQGVKALKAMAQAPAAQRVRYAPEIANLLAWAIVRTARRNRAKVASWGKVPQKKAAQMVQEAKVEEKKAGVTPGQPAPLPEAKVPTAKAPALPAVAPATGTFTNVGPKPAAEGVQRRRAEPVRTPPTPEQVAAAVKQVEQATVLQQRKAEAAVKALATEPPRAEEAVPPMYAFAASLARKHRKKWDALDKDDQATIEIVLRKWRPWEESSYQSQLVQMIDDAIQSGSDAVQDLPSDVVEAFGSPGMQGLRGLAAITLLRQRGLGAIPSALAFPRSTFATWGWSSR